MRIVQLGEVASLDRRTVDPTRLDPDTPYLGLEHIESGGRILGHSSIGSDEVRSTKFLFDKDHLLYGKLRPNLGKIAIPTISGVCSTDILPIKMGTEVDRGYLAHYLRQPSMVTFSASRTSGINLPRLSPAVLAKFPVPLPSLEDQRRIAANLDQADALRAKRRQVLAHLDALTQSIFHQMFGTGQFAIVPLKSVMFGFRNGLSPSSTGPHPATVLTLAAVTGGRFNPLSAKEATFAAKPPKDKRVTADDFLVCRGNGNKSLVGVGTFSAEHRPDLVFPDTVIAGTANQARVTMNYLSAAWKQPSVRHQIEAGARTTNGTHKINQQVLASIMLPLPPIDMQRSFDDQIKQVSLQQQRAGRSLAALDALSQSLQSRAFRGEL